MIFVGKVHELEIPFELVLILAQSFQRLAQVPVLVGGCVVVVAFFDNFEVKLFKESFVVVVRTDEADFIVVYPAQLSVELLRDRIVL